MNRKQIVTGAVGLTIGFILGFFVHELVKPPVTQFQAPAQDAGTLPADHPSPEQLQQLQALELQASADPQDAHSRIHLGNAFYDMGRFDLAIRWYEEAVKLEPENIDLNTDLATSYLYMDNVEKAIELYKKSLSLDAAHPQSLQNIGVAFYARDDFQEAIRFWQKLVDLHPEYPHREEIKKQIENARKKLDQG